MSAKTIAVANMKGGVGKTTVVVSLAETLAAVGAGGRGARVLVVDLDAQANASFSLVGDTVLLELILSGRTIDAFLEDRMVFGHERALLSYRCDNVGVHNANTNACVSLVASSPELRIVEREMIVFASQNGRSLKAIAEQVGEVVERETTTLREMFDYILFDCAPGVSLLTEACLRASDAVIVPTVPNHVSNLGLEAFCKSVPLAKPHANGGGKLPRVLANRVRGTPGHRHVLAEMRAESAAADAGFTMLRTELPERDEIGDVTAWREARRDYVAKYAGEVAHVFADLAREIG
jgi:cellulose biosynthesis protein BcsQ